MLKISALTGVLLMIFLSTSAFPSNKELTGKIRIGERSTGSDYEEEDGDRDYKIHEYGLKWADTLKKLYYDVSYLFEDKDYVVGDRLDNKRRTGKNNYTYIFKKTKEHLIKGNLDLRYTEKRFKHKPTGNYDRFKLLLGPTYEKKDNFKLDLSWGLDRYTYSSGSQKNLTIGSTSAKLTKHIKPDVSKVVASYRIEEADKKAPGKDRTK